MRCFVGDEDSVRIFVLRIVLPYLGLNLRRRDTLSPLSLTLKIVMPVVYAVLCVRTMQ